MAELRPFRGSRYDLGRFKRPETLFAPPYDVVDLEGRHRLVKAQPYNIFKLELPQRADCLDQGLNVKDRYQCASLLLRSWMDEGIIKADPQPCLYTYSIRFRANGSTFTRTGFICLVRADDWEKRTILPHEKTFNKVTEERLRLRLATRAQFSQIFMLYRHDQALSSILDQGPEEMLAQLDDPAGCTHSLGRITDPERISAITESLKDRPLYIADGHHRYTTAINYRKEMARRLGDDPEAPYNFTMAYLVDAEDPGLIVLPTHRILTLPASMGVSDLEERLSEVFQIRELAPAQNDAEQTARLMEQALKAECTQAIGLITGRQAPLKLLCLKPEAAQALLSEAGHKALASLDVMVLEKVVFERALGISAEELELGKDLFYEADSVKAVERLDGNRVLFFMNPTPVGQVLDVADAGLTMPHKSTFFYPKILSGLVMNVEEV